MHAVVMDSLEEYLSGELEPVAQRRVEAHLNACHSCREEVRSMQDVSSLLHAFRTDEVLDPSPGFTARVVQQVAELEPAPTFANLFALDFAFGRKLVFASLMT